MGSALPREFFARLALSSSAALDFSGTPHAGNGVPGSNVRHSQFKSASGLQGRLAIIEYG